MHCTLLRWGTIILATCGAFGCLAFDDKAAAGPADDQVRTQIENALRTDDKTLGDEVGVAVVGDRALLTGKVADAGARERAVKDALTASSIQEIINEILVGNPAPKDSGTAASVAQALAGDSSVTAANYAISTVDGVAYVLGTAPDRTEYDKVLTHARETPGVKAVVSYIDITPAATVTAGTEAPPPPLPTAPIESASIDAPPVTPSSPPPSTRPPMRQASAAVPVAYSGHQGSRRPASGRSTSGRPAHGYLVQLASIAERDAAEREWRRLADAHAGILRGRPHRVDQVDLGALGIRYHVSLGPFARREDAELVCRRLKTQGLKCILVSP